MLSVIHTPSVGVDLHAQAGALCVHISGVQEGNLVCRISLFKDATVVNDLQQN